MALSPSAERSETRVLAVLGSPHVEIASAVSQVRPLLDGVRVHPCTTFPDRRGTFTEVFRAEWDLGVHPCQWDSIVTTQGGVVRGVKVHLRHSHVVILQLGAATIGLRDLRSESSTGGLAVTIEADASTEITAVTIPHGVAHGFYFHEPSVLLIGDTSYHDPGDQLRCYWADPDLGIPWPATDAMVSDEDAAGLTFAEFVAAAALEPRT